MTHTPNDMSLRPNADGVPGNGGAPGGGFGGTLGGDGTLGGGGDTLGGVPEIAHTPPSHCASLKHALPLESAFTKPTDDIHATAIVVIETNARRRH